MPGPVVNLDSLEYKRFGRGEAFAAERAPVSPLLGAKKLGYAVIRLQPGKRAWPYHAHRAIEEAFFVLSGSGTLRHAGEEYALRAGDFVCSPADPEQPHQIVNTSDAELTYIAISNVVSTDVVHYPDSGKVGVWHGDATAPGAAGNFAMFVREVSAVDYWEGEVDD